jgi:hypothetical protein
MTASRVRATIGSHHSEERTMSESTNETPADEPKADEPKADETFTWTNEGPTDAAGKGAGGTTAASILDSVRDVVDELAERAAPTVRELSARAAELTAIAADKAAPFAKRAGEVTADASGKLATRSREWASELRAEHDSGTSQAAPAAAEPAAAEPTAGGEPAEGARDIPDDAERG